MWFVVFFFLFKKFLAFLFSLVLCNLKSHINATEDLTGGEGVSADDHRD